MESGSSGGKPDSVDLWRGEVVYSGIPKVIPDLLLERLAKLFRSFEYIDEAFFGQVCIPARKELPHVAVQVKLDRSQRNLDRFQEEISPKIDLVVEEVLRKNETVEVIALLSKEPPLSGLKRFYHRST